MEESNQVIISVRDTDMASVICQNSRDNLYAFLKRMDLDVDPTWEKEVLAMLLKDTILDDPEYIFYIYGREILDFLIELWESDSMELYSNSWAILGQLKLLGFADIEYDRHPDGIAQICMVSEARDNFYYYLKSRTARACMEYYYDWEVLVRGLLSYYGIISFNRLYYLFCRLIKSPVDDAKLHRFISVRMELFHYGMFVKDSHTNIEYYQNYEITVPDQVLQKRQERKRMEYYFPDYEELFYASQNNGIGDWDGVHDLAEIFLQLLDMEYYQTVITIKACVLMLQNDETPSKVEGYLCQCCPEIRRFQDKMKRIVLTLYDSVPVYSLKGWSRKELRRKQLTELPFQIIQGGKNSPEKGKGGN